MRDKGIYVMCGVPGCGKSTWARKNAKPGHSAIISRDRIRFDMLSPNDDYFKYEDEVLEQFYKQINMAIESPWVDEIYVDATHLTEKARNQLLDNIDVFAATELVMVWFNISLETCLERNAQRTGRALVPEKAIRNMYKSFQQPIYDEKYEYDGIIEVSE